MTNPTQMRAAHVRSLQLTTDIVAAVSADHLDLDTPCAQWTVRQLLEHMVGQNHGFANAARGGGDLQDWAPRSLAGNPAAAWADSVLDVETAVADLAVDGVLLMPEVRPAPLPAEVAISFLFLDTLVHGWDVATASGQPLRCPDDLAELLLTVATRVPADPESRRPGAAFLLPVDAPPSADPFGCALALVGRDPKWGRDRRATRS